MPAHTHTFIQTHTLLIEWCSHQFISHTSCWAHGLEFKHLLLCLVSSVTTKLALLHIIGMCLCPVKALKFTSSLPHILTLYITNGMVSIKPPPPLPATPVPSGPGTPYYQGFTNTLRHVTCGRTPLDEGSARSKDLYLTTHNTHMNETSIPPVVLQITIPVSEWPQTHTKH